MGTASFTVLTWNLRWMTRGAVRVAAKRDLLSAIDWDVALLQEVGPRAFASLSEAFPGGAFAHDLHNSGDRYPHGVAILSRGDVRLVDAHLVPVGDPRPDGFVQPERALAATAYVDGRPITVASWHAPHAAGRSRHEALARRDQKMRAYRAISDWAAGRRHPLVLGGDMNTWADVRSESVLDAAHPFFEEHRFHAAAPVHGLTDAYRRVIAASRALGALDDDGRAGAADAHDGTAATYDRGHGGRSIPCRMDRIYVSDEIAVHDVEHRPLAEARAVGSDHGIVRVRCAV